MLITISDSYLIEMLTDPEVEKKDSAVKCLEVLSTSKPEHWKSILEAGENIITYMNLILRFNLCHSVF